MNVKIKCGCFISGILGLLFLGVVATGCSTEEPSIPIPLPLDQDDMLPLPPEAVEESNKDITAYYADAPTVLFLNFDGATLTKSSREDASQNLSYFWSVTLPAFNVNQSVKDAIVAKVKDLYKAYNINVVTSRPANGYYDMMVVGGYPEDVGLSSGVTGVAPMDCGNKVLRNIGLAFGHYYADLLKQYKSYSDSILALNLGNTIAHEAAHIYGLPHSDNGCDVMSYSKCSNGNKSFLDLNMGMQSDSVGMCGLNSMNSYRMLLDVLAIAPSNGGGGNTKLDAGITVGKDSGNVVVNKDSGNEGNTGGTSSDTTAPVVKITTPGSYKYVASEVKVTANITDNVGVTKAELYIGNTLLATLTNAPYEWNIVIKQHGMLTIKVVAYDEAGNTGSNSVRVLH